MRIYAVADIHGKVKNIQQIKDIITRKSPDILVIAGDITNYFSPGKTFAQLKNIPIPIFGVRGNSDSKYVEALLQNQENTTFLNHIPVVYQKFSFLGLNGTLPLPFASKICFQETRRMDTIRQGIFRKTILVVHPPPRGICDKVGNRFSAGSFKLKTLIENHPPLMVLCGHIHEQAGYQSFNNTWVVNCAMNKKFSGAIIECGKDIPLKINMILNDK